MIFSDSLCQLKPDGPSFRKGSAFLLNLIVSILLGFGMQARPAFAQGDPSAATYVVKRGDTLSDIALKYKISIQELRDWNELESDQIFQGQRLDVRPPRDVKTYVVRSGETLFEIASRFSISVSSLQNLNDIHDNRIYPGQTLRLRQPDTAHPEPKTYVVVKGDTLWKISRRVGLSVSEIKEINGLDSESILPGTTLSLVEPAAEEETTPEEFEYVVQKGDNLSGIARRFNVGVNLLRQLNKLKDDRISPGQRLQVRPSSLDEAVHIVRAGDTLSDIALKYGISVSKLREINDIQGNRILVGDELRVKEAPASTYIVERGDALWEIARAYKMSVEELMRLNGLSSDQIYPGQELELGRMPSDPYDTYLVKAGDNLMGIARLYQMSVSDLKKVNNLSASVIYPGEKLKVNPLLDAGRKWSKISDIDWKNLMTSSQVNMINADNGPYYYSRPAADHQKRATYYENPHLTPLQSYRRARKLWENFKKTVEKLGRVSNALNGWYFVLDPGHGGLDPGTVVEVLDGNGNKLYVVEDEYVYDLALRVYVLLRLNGANVTMTLLSPDHLIRQSDPPTSTFVNEKNEVYNSYQLNKSNKWSDWPSGGSDGNLRNRVKIASEFFRNVPKNRSIFLSFHADIEPNAPEAPLVLYYRSKNGRKVDTASKKFASALLPALGAGAYTRGQPLGVLRDNPAGLKLLLELRNLAYPDHAWALRFEQLRQRDAEKVVKGILDQVQQKTRLAKGG